MSDSTLRETVAALLPDTVARLAELVRLPSEFRADPARRRACAEAAGIIRTGLFEAGFHDARLQETPDGSFTVIGRRQGAPGAPTILLYSHYDIQPEGDPEAWTHPPFELTRVGERLFGRGAADCKGGVVAHFAALRAIGAARDVTIRFVCEGSEEQGGRGLDAYIRANPREFDDIDAALILDAANPGPGRPAIVGSLRGVVVTRVTVRTGTRALHSGSFGGAVPDASLALIRILASLRDDDGATVIDGLPETQPWLGDGYDEKSFRQNAGLPEDARILGSADIATRLWARPALSVMATDIPPLDEAVPAIQPSAQALLNLRVPPGLSARTAADALRAHIEGRNPWGAEIEIQELAVSDPFVARPDGPARTLLAQALHTAHGHPVAAVGDGGSIPLCGTLQAVAPQAEILLFGISEPGSNIHAVDESVLVGDLEAAILAEATFLTSIGDRLREGTTP